jgi:hypothetical protein
MLNTALLYYYYYYYYYTLYCINAFSSVQGSRNPIGTFLAKKSNFQTEASDTQSVQPMISSSPVRVPVDVFVSVFASRSLLASNMIAQISLDLYNCRRRDETVDAECLEDSGTTSRVGSTRLGQGHWMNWRRNSWYPRWDVAAINGEPEQQIRRMYT